ncbi:fatty-acid peroxygenase [Geomicrobium halophilum]|uniref:Fatty-acid peroxygenase n=1 Tax=Geomicrobium halophilum TaxID=549000 RepID=A0A841PQT8_9BACL|nr:cytochrome P450 [Geomicrobium halophilum]MBB6451119.1 fatty-acid peroxygenase [Geomicrobium halophilum]
MSSTTKQLPKEKGIDHTLALLNEGYRFVLNRREKKDSDIVQTRLLGQKVILISGEDAAELFYDEDLFKRKNVAPKRVEKSLFGENGVQGLDDEEHKHRKLMFLSLMTPERLKDIEKITMKHWKAKLPDWKMKNQVVLFDEAEEVMCRSACEWAGVPIEEEMVEQRAQEFGFMIDAFGGVGERYQRGKKARQSSEKWIEGIIKQIRSKKLQPPENTAAYVIANHRDRKGKLLNTHTAAVELINILRPIVAIGRYVVFGALAMHDYPEETEKLRAGDGNYNRMFVQEIRRYYPFTPLLGANARKDFTWKGYPFKKNTLVMLDVYGINHHPDLWDRPNEFRPERFKEWEGSPFAFVPQGGGDHYMGHRCAGEWITIMLMQVSLEFLINHVEYEVPEQELEYSMERMPTIPKSRFIMNQIQSTAE